MGWSSWNTFSVNISEKLIKGQADAMVSQGLKDVGYDHINIDDGFQYGRLANGKVRIHPERFPNGIKVVADYIHSKGLKAGIYSDAGDCTCGSISNGDTRNTNVGFYDHDQIDAEYYFGECGYDFIKVDYCGGSHLALDEQERYTAISNALRAVNPEGELNICRWAYPGDWAHDVSVSWRTTGDIYDGWASVRGILDENLYMNAYCYGGTYNDMDMLEVGRSMTAEEDRTHFGMWCIMSSPLLIGCNLATIRPDALALLKNTELIALNQDSLALQAHVVQHTGETYVLVKDIEQRYGTTRAVALYNPSDKEQFMAVSFDELDLGGNVQVRDLFEHQDLGTMTSHLAVRVPAHGTRIYRLQAEHRIERYRYEAETGYMPCYQEIFNHESKGTGIVQRTSSASGEAFCGWLGNRAENNLQWRDVVIAEAGDYTLGFVCATAESRSFDVLVDGVLVGTVTANTGEWAAFKEYSLQASLPQGVHNITLRNASGWMPNIDCMLLHRTDADAVKSRQLTALVCQLRALSEGYALPSKLQANIATLLASVEEGTSSVATLTTKVNTMISTIQQMLPTLESYATWLAAAEYNISISVESSALTTLQEKLASAATTLDGATSNTTAQRALTSLQSALKSYLLNVEALPQEGKQLDMTILIANPRFASTDGWKGTMPDLRSGSAQLYDKEFDLNQTLSSMRPGIYTIQVNALFRIGDNNAGSDYMAGRETIPAELYAGDASTALLSLYSYDWEDAANYGPVDNNNGYPHSMYAARLCFDQGAYLNTLQVSHPAKGSLKFGLRSTAKLPAHSWCCFNYFTLHFQPFPTEDAVQQIEAESPTTPYYNLAGQPVSPRTRGIVVKQGKKVIKK